MEPTRVTLDEATAARLAGANGRPVPLCNPAGAVIGYYVSSAEMERQQTGWYPGHPGLWTDAEIARITERLKDKSRPKRTTEEVLRLVEGQ